ncbi:DNA-directed primase/polymerase protein isoform X2 [Dendrobium catenatum]|uniref:DNA-directed primase/polymerase protein isoform X2 n=1 Tax=Dendrobium catenatum TaxID=906689 RepID=UPI0009F6B048|nr:DNA-directed primase/polymerase protein isoform X2 [Dendrobium catenatum]
MAYDLKDDVDRLFACFKCGVSPPPSALKERKSSERKPSGPAKGGSGSPVVDEKEAPSCSKQGDDNVMEGQKCGSSTTAAIKFRSGKQISPVIFYGSARGVPVKRPSRILRLLQEIRVDLREENVLIPRDGVWATFPRQEEAFRFARTHRNSNVFSYQDHLTGKRRFLVSTYVEFWRRYKSMDSKLRHHYEVIQEGHPCHLYFDLEFDKRLNIGRNVDEMVDILISVTLTAIYEKYSIQANHELVVELDSSTEEKFSRHLIIRLPKTAFKDNSHVGAFVSEICSRIASLREIDPRVNKLYIRKDSCCSDSADHLFLDSAVYSRNRCFRLAFSSKSGKSSFLLPTGRFKCKNMTEQQVLLESLICRMEEDFEKILICKMDIDCMKALSFDTEDHVQHQNFLWEVDSNLHSSGTTSSYVTGRSPFPALDAFVESIASIGSALGKIQSWYWFSSYGLMVYNMSRNRYCERIGREHKSNHVMYVVDFQRAGYYQKCHDPDCRGYRSPLRPLPWDVFPDSSTLSNSIQIENYEEVVNIDIDLQLGNANMDAFDSEQLLTDSCTDMSWWHEAINFAECIENMRNVSDFSVLDKDIMDDDSAWWTYVEKIVTS